MTAGGAHGASGGGIRVAISGCGHWHLPLYLDPLRRIDDVRVVGVADPQAEVASAVGARVGCPSFGDVHEMCAATRPDFVFALGRHCDMLADGLALIDSAVAFAMEKPCGLSGDEVSTLASAVERSGLFAAVPFVMRQTDLAGLIAEDVARASVTNLSFRMIAGPPSRYLEAGCEWMLAPALSGGGCTINLSVHFIDLMFALFGDRAVTLGTVHMSSDAGGYPVEDYSLLTLTGDGVTCAVETGYLFPAPTAQYDMHFSVRSDRRYLVATTSTELDVIAPDGSRERRLATTTNVPVYPTFVADVLSRVRADRSPIASMADMARVMTVVDQAYERPPRDQRVSSGPHANHTREVLR